MRPQTGLRVPDADTTSPLPVEVAGLADSLAPGVLALARERAQRLGVGADEVLIAAGSISAEAATRGAARRLGLGFSTLDEGPTSGEPHRAPFQGRPLLGRDFADIAGALRTGVLRGSQGRLIYAARGLKLRQLAQRVATDPTLRGAVLLTTPERLSAYVRRRFAAPLAREAALGLIERQPALSAGTLGLSRLVFALLAVVMALSPFLRHGAPAPVASALVLLISVLLLGWCTLRLTACITPARPSPPPLMEDRSLPVYTLIVALYREASVVPQLTAALRALDYPREKLQVLLVLEADDRETAGALSAQLLPSGFEIVVAPALGPRTKPKALNAALPFARGTLIGVYDAEDEPDPLQLRRVCATFERPGPARLGCVQARLAIDNVADGWLTRQFAAEYAGHFDVLLPTLATNNLPFPLGGTSNHFRRDALESLGAWDPHNVTEDADLGVRLARAGWRVEVIDSSTDEEAPRYFGAWLRQRTRWYKGWMQTLLVHGRHPVRLLREAGAAGTLSFVFMLGGGVGAALVHPFFLLSVLQDLLQPPTPPSSLAFIDAVAVTVLVLGCLSTLLATGLGMARRGYGRIAVTLALQPLYWLIMSLAAWRALGQLLLAPQRWEKTDHGLARTSRRRGRLVRIARAGGPAYK